MKKTPQEALSIVYQALRTLNINAEAHEQLRACIEVLNEAITPKPTEDKPKK